jgi:hypothetical protein
MTIQEKIAAHERAAVAYAHRLLTDAGLIWREITGQDIGIDAILELPYADVYGVRGFALLQIKSQDGAVVNKKVKVVYRERHHLYWLTQRLPVLLCVVKPSDADGFSTGVAGHWIDYKSLKLEECSISASTDKRWTLRIPVGTEHVWSSGPASLADWSSEAKAFRDWIETVLVQPAEEIVRSFCEAADGYLGSGKPDRANACLKQIPIGEEVLLRPGTRRSVTMLLAKTFRRLGAVEEQQQLVDRAGQDYGKAEFLLYELALTYWTKACKTPFPGADLESWEKAIEVLGAPSDWMKATAEALKPNLVRLGAYINFRSMLSCVPDKEREAPEVELCHRLSEVIAGWRTCQDKDIVLDPRYHLQLLNALRALCRGYLSRREVTEAEKVLRELKEAMATNPDRETLALTDFLILTAWAAVENGKHETAAATLDCTAYLLNSMRDPVLEWFQDVVRAKWDEIRRQDTYPHPN